MNGCILPFPKKGDLGLAKNFRGITLTSLAAKIYNVLQRNRIGPKIDNILRKNQNNFPRNRSTTSQILTIRRILGGVRVKKPRGNNIFCRLYQGLLFNSQSEDGVNSTCIRPTKRNRRSHNDSLKKQQSESAFSGWRHRLLRHCSVDDVLRTSLDKIKENSFKLTKERTRRYPAKTITDADFVDDIALFANAPTQAETLLHSQERAAAAIGLHVKAHKTIALWN